MWVFRGAGKRDHKAHESSGFFQTMKGDITEDMPAEYLQRAGLVQTGTHPVN